MTDHLHEYELIMYDMAEWISAQTWGGHEKTCPLFMLPDVAYAQRIGVKCDCINVTLDKMRVAIKECYLDKTRAIAQDRGHIRYELDTVRDEILRLNSALYELANRERKLEDSERANG